MFKKLNLEDQGDGSPLSVNRSDAMWMEFLTVLEQIVVLVVVCPWMQETV